jgi:response regulator RpfG family c-di-GMP phosphodiesterase
VNRRILFVDDEPRVLTGFRRQLRGDCEPILAESGFDALKILTAEPPFAVIVSDMNMPGMNGVDLLDRCQRLCPNTVRLMLTGMAELDVAMQAVNRCNIFRFLTKPCSVDDLRAAVEAALRQHQLIVSERELLDRTLKGSVRALAEVLEAVNPTAFGRAGRVQRLARLVIEATGKSMTWSQEVAARLCQIGCVTVPEELLQRAASGDLLSDEEKQVLAEHPCNGARMLSRIPRMAVVSRGIGYQAKRYDGYGLPADGLRGDDIPLVGRLLKLCLDFEALVMGGDNPARALAELESCAAWYDPSLLEALADVVQRGRTHQRDQLMIPDLEIGMIVDENVAASDGTLLVARGTDISQPLLRRLDNWHRLERVHGPLQVLIPLGDDAFPF